MIHQSTTAESLPVSKEKKTPETHEPIMRTIKELNNAIHDALIQEGFSNQELIKNKKARDVLNHLIRTKQLTNVTLTTVKEAAKTVLNEE